MQSPITSNDIVNHVNNTSNPHLVTKSQVGLGNCDNTSDENKPISTATQAALDGKQATLAAGTGIDISDTTISAKQTYSISETETGKYWIDGKKIYRKCFSGTQSVYSEYSSAKRRFYFGEVSSDVAALINFGGSIKPNKNSTTWIPYNISQTNDANSLIIFQPEVQLSTAGLLTLREFVSRNVATPDTSIEYNVWVEYTKS